MTNIKFIGSFNYPEQTGKGGSMLALWIVLCVFGYIVMGSISAKIVTNKLVPNADSIDKELYRFFSLVLWPAIPVCIAAYFSFQLGCLAYNLPTTLASVTKKLAEKKTSKKLAPISQLPTLSTAEDEFAALARMEREHKDLTEEIQKKRKELAEKASRDAYRDNTIAFPKA